jgi:hypothetical protein
MSTVFPGGSGITISPGQTQTWTFTWDVEDWNGITILQPQPIGRAASLNYSDTTVTNKGIPAFWNYPQYAFTWTVHNPNDFTVTFNIQTSWFD